MMRRLYSKRGQSTLEYVVIWTAVIFALLVAANNFIKPRVEQMVDEATNKIVEETGDLTAGIGN